MKWRTRGLLFDMDGVLVSSLGLGGAQLDEVGRDARHRSRARDSHSARLQSD